MGAAALDAAQAIAVAGISVEGRHAYKRGGFCGGKRPKLGQAGYQRRGDDRPTALDRQKNFVAVFQDGIGLDKRRGGRIQVCRRALASAVSWRLRSRCRTLLSAAPWRFLSAVSSALAACLAKMIS